MRYKIIFIALFIFSFPLYAKPNNNQSNGNKTYITNNNYSYTENEIKNGYIAELNFRILDTKKTTTEIFYSYDFNNEVNYSGIKFTIKVGKSYCNRELEKIKNRLEKLK